MTRDLPGTRLSICVYRRSVPTPVQTRRTTEAATADPLLRRFLDEYWRDDRYYDWGDDPSFFCTTTHIGDLARTSWGVCRPDVRESAQIGDAVAFFCGKPDVEHVGSNVVRTGPADYFFVGCGTIAELVDRRDVWRLVEYEPYRTFYNVLAAPDDRGRLQQHETFHPYHPNWERRADAPYILFDPQRTFFNIDRPHHVSRYTPEEGVPDDWRHDAFSRRLERLLLEGRSRRLRTSDGMHQHAKMTIRLPANELRGLVDALIEIAASS